MWFAEISVLLRYEICRNNMKKMSMILVVIFLLTSVIACSGEAKHKVLATVVESDAEVVTAIDTGCVDIVSTAIEREYQSLILGEWQLLKINMILTTVWGQEENHLLTPTVWWRFEDDGYYYETSCYQGDTVVRQYGYSFRNDSIMLQESPDPRISPWHVIDTLSADRLVLISIDSVKDGKLKHVYTLQKVAAEPVQP